MLGFALLSFACLILSAHGAPLAVGSTPSTTPPTKFPPLENIQFTLHAVQYKGQPALEGAVSWMSTEPIRPQSLGGPLGWFYNSTDPTNSIPADRRKVLVAFVQFGAESGIVFDSSNTVRQVYRAPGEPGQMIVGPEPSDVGNYKSVFTVTKKDGKYWYGVKHAKGHFMYCKTQGGNLLKFGKRLGPNCAQLKGLEVKFVIPRNS